MPHPVIFVVSSDVQLAATLQAQLAETFELEFCSSLAEARTLLRKIEPWALVADFRSVLAGGHLEERFLEEVAAHFTNAEILTLIGRSCPEPIERRLACNAIPHLCEPVSGEELAMHFLDRVATDQPPELPPVIEAPTPRLADAEPEYVVTGLTRRFETNTPRLRMMLADLEIAARHDVTVLLIGETGAGKTYLSRLIHEISPRRNEPFLPVACGALPDDLIESELFGHVRGAFTSAHADKEGKFLAARKGTILLDEIDVLGLEQQVKLLRVIESGEFEPVGSNRTYKCEARLIVASNLDLQPLVEQGKFRPDLYYRLNMLKFELLPLRHRRPDIVPLARKFIHEFTLKHNIRIERVEDSLFNSLLRYPWPGNVRELEHVIQRAVIYCRDAVLTAQHLPTHVVMCMAGPGNDGRPVDDRALLYDPTTATLDQQVALSEREIIEQTLFKHNNSRTNTARALGISRVTLYNKMKKYGMTK